MDNLFNCEKKELSLRDYQIADTDKARDIIKQGKKRVVISEATGAGKTVMAVHLINSAYAKGSRITFICDRISLLNQTSAVLDSYGIIEHGIIQGTHERTNTDLRIQIASAQTLRRRKVKDSDLYIVDECHTSHKVVIDMLKENKAVFIGLSATPFTKGMGKIWDAVISSTSTNKLIQTGMLSKYSIFAHSEPDMNGVKVRSNGEWEEGETVKRSLPVIGDIISEYCKHAIGRKFIVFGVNVAHCNEILRQFNDNGILASLYTYKETDADKEAIMSEFRKPDSAIKGLISVSALSKGLDVPDLSCVIVARPLRKSLSEHIQMIGRGLRACDGKEDCVILDHSGNSVRFWEDMNNYFENSVTELDDGKSSKKKQAKKKEKKPIKCPMCAHIHKPMPFCPKCNHQYKTSCNIQHEVGELLELNPVDRIKKINNLWLQILAHGQKNNWKTSRCIAVYIDITKQNGNDKIIYPTDNNTYGIECSDYVEKLIHKSQRAWFMRNKNKFIKDKYVAGSISQTQ